MKTSLISCKRCQSKEERHSLFICYALWKKWSSDKASHWSRTWCLFHRPTEQGKGLVMTIGRSLGPWPRSTLKSNLSPKAFYLTIWPGLYAVSVSVSFKLFKLTVQNQIKSLKVTAVFSFDESLSLERRLSHCPMTNDSLKYMGPQCTTAHSCDTRASAVCRNSLMGCGCRRRCHDWVVQACLQVIDLQFIGRYTPCSVT